MTSISSALTSSQYQYKSTASVASILSADDSSDSSSSSTATTAASTTASSDSSTSDATLIAAAEKLLSQMMMMMLDNQSGSSTSDSSSGTSTSGSVATTASSTAQAGTVTGSQSDPVTAMDTNGDGSVSEAEFVAARPSDVSEDQASALFESFDSDNTGSLTDDQLSQDMQASAPPPPPQQGTQFSDSDLSDIFSSMDTNGDGAVSEAEFVAARPSDLSEDQASSLFDSLDSSQSGSLSESQFASGVKSDLAAAQPPQMPAFSSLFSAGFSDDTTQELLTV